MMFHWYHFWELDDRFLEVEPRMNEMEMIFQEKKNKTFFVNFS